MISSPLEKPQPPGDETIIWRDGAMLKKSANGRWRELPAIPALPEAKNPEAKTCSE
jgi:hypothetical protein